jgi:hypothetical protein
VLQYARLVQVVVKKMFEKRNIFLTTAYMAIEIGAGSKKIRGVLNVAQRT